MALGFKSGAEKYGPFNWRTNSVAASVYIAAALRHILAYADGQDIDEDSGYPVLAHALASLAIAVDATETGNLVDDRVKGAAAGLLKRWSNLK